MAKRFTDTEKWKKAWYRKLGSKKRDVLNYLWDNCDHAGVWEIDTETLSYFIGEEVELNHILEWFGDRVKRVEDDKLFIPSFIEFQYGELSEECKPHISVLKRLHKLQLFEHYPKGIHTLKDKDKDKEQDQEKEKIEKPKFDFEPLYRLYPLRKGKTPGIKLCVREIKTPESYSDLAKAIENYCEEVRREKTEKKFIKHFSTFMGEWRDWVDYRPEGKPRMQVVPGI